MIKKDTLAIKAIIIALIIMFVTAIVGGCTSLWIFHQMSGGGSRIRKIIYTDHPETYIEGKTLVDEIRFNETTSFNASNANWCHVIETGTPNVYDFIFIVDPSTGSYMANVGYSTEFCLWLGGDGSGAIFDNSYIFSGRLGYYAAGGHGDCLIPDCNCSHLYDIFDKVCIHSYGSSSYTSDTQISLDEARTKMGITCPGCYEITETISNGKYYYSANDVCQSKMKFFHDGTFTRPLTKCIVFNLSGSLSSFRYEELVLDGYDFSLLYDGLVAANYDSLYTNWEQYFDPSDFSHMFSDLPVKKITIKNVKGLGHRAKDLSGMFENCPNLEEIEFGNLFEDCKPTDISNMFFNCPKLKSVDLSTLDTSEVTNMSNMFATGKSGLYISESAREKLINKYINDNIAMFAPELADGRDWTFNMLLEEVNSNLSENEKMTKEDLLFKMVFEMSLNISLTYDELSLAMFDIPFTELVIAAMENPEMFELPAKSDPYTYAEIVEYYTSQLALYGVSDPMFDGLLYANGSREELINYTINKVYVPIYLDPNDTTEYTLDSIVKKLNQQQTFSGTTLTKEEFLFNLIRETGIAIPITWDELSYATANVSFADLIKLINLNPEEFGLEQKLDGTDYTEQDIIDLFAVELKDFYLNVVTDKELVEIYSGGGSPNATLILGGENSKFVISAGTDVSHMFGSMNNFGTIVTPNEIHESITIELPYLYTNSSDSEVTVQTITSSDTNKTYGYYIVEEPELPVITPNEENSTPKTWLTTTEIVAISVGGGSVVLGCLVALLLLIVVTKKPVSRY